MENEGLLGTSAALSWQLSNALPPPELNSGQPADQLTPPSYLKPNWDQSIDPNVHFESALSSLLSSPSAAESLVIRELIGRLGSICNSGEISPTSRYHSTNTSCYSSPLNSPPKLNISMIDTHQLEQGQGGLRPILGGPPPATHHAPFSADPDFAERAARFSCFGGRRSYSSGLTAQFGPPEAGKLLSVSSSQSLKTGGTQMGAPGNEIPMQAMFGNILSESSTPDDGELGCSGQEESSASGQITTGGEAGSKTAGKSNARKRKAAPKGKGREVHLSSIVNPAKVAEEEEDVKAKRCRSSEINGAKKDLAVKPKAENNDGVTTIGDVDKKPPKNAKSLEPPKDYIHVRARRGQATDSHSLAERVRREKISDRMKFLQDLVPGCNKVTGKAAMLDEIINYVQSLQRQVEFLSMKLTAVNTRLDFGTESFILKEMNQVSEPMPPHSVYPLETTSMAFSCAHQPQGTPLQTLMTNGFETQYSMNSLDGGLRQSLSMQLPVLDGFGDATSQRGTFWDDDLESVVQMGSVQNAEAAFSSQSFHGRLNGQLL